MIQTGGCWQKPAKALSTISCILFDTRKRERNKNKGMKEKKKEKKFRTREWERTSPKKYTRPKTNGNGIFIMKAKESKHERLFGFRWCPTSLLEAKWTFCFFLTIKWLILKLYSDTERIKLVWLGLGWVITSPSRTLHIQAETSREERGRSLKSRCMIPMA